MSEIDLTKRSTAEVLEHHLTYLQHGDLEETMADYGDDSVIVNMGGPVVGKAAIREFFRGSIASCLPPESTYETMHCHVYEEIAYTVWSAESPFYSVPYGTDTFIIRGGKIVQQTFAGILNAK